MEIQPDQREPIVNGVAALAVTIAEMGEDEGVARASIVQQLMRLKLDQRDLVPVLRAAVTAIAQFPQPIDHPPERLARGEHIRRALGLPEPSDELAASLRAREWIERLADDLERRLTSGD
ncbi:MAG: hypothetical protein ACREXY_12365 [Gammaproteobacteria bacterium]